MNEQLIKNEEIELNSMALQYLHKQQILKINSNTTIKQLE